MKYKLLGIFLLIILTIFVGCSGETMTKETSNMSDYVTKSCGTEPAFNNAYWNEHRLGLYFDVNTNEPLFSSRDKFDSGSGWPSFTQPLNGSTIYEKVDTSLDMQRTEVRTTASHLGHVFDDGPNGSQRYCINSAALKFVPFEKLDKKYQDLFPYEKAIFAGGCFWGVEHLLENIDGVVDTVVGYAGGTTKNPTYYNMGDYAEAVYVVFDPKIISYDELLKIFWRVHDPTQLNKQGPDKGLQYRSAIFYFNESQNKMASASMKAFDASGVFDKPAVTLIVPFESFYSAEEYHQKYIDKNPLTYCHALRNK